MRRGTSFGAAASRCAVVAIAVVVAAVVAAGCGGADPTAERPVRELEAVPPASEAADIPRDETSPSHGLPCDVQLDAGEQLDARRQLGLCGAATDNYKASFNEDPSARELRTWLAIHALEIADTEGAEAAVELAGTWEPVAGTPLTAEHVELHRVDGAPGTLELRAEVVNGPGRAATLRTGPQHGLFGPLLTLDGDPDALRDSPVVVELMVQHPRSGKPTITRTRVEYRFDKSLADAPESSLEHNGPGGRWFVAGLATATNLELGWE